MPFIYNVQSKMVAENFATNGTPNTETDHMFIKPSATRPVGIWAFRPQGKAAQATSLTGIEFRIGLFPTTASSGGTGVTPNPASILAPAATFTCGQSASAGVTPGTGTFTYVGGCGCSQSGPGGWQAINIDAALQLDGNQNKSLDVKSSSPVASMNFAYQCEAAEA